MQKARKEKMQIPFEVGLYCPHSFWMLLLKELWPQYKVFNTKEDFDRAWYEKTLPVRAYILSDKDLQEENKNRYFVENWNHSRSFSLPINHQEVEHLLKELAKIDYYTIYKHGVCCETLIDPAGKQIKLTQKEEQLLVYLMHHPKSTKDVLLANIWGYQAVLETHTLETHISCLRQKVMLYSCAPFDILCDQEGYSLGPRHSAF